MLSSSVIDIANCVESTYGSHNRTAVALASFEASENQVNKMNFSRKTNYLLWSMSDILRQLLDNIAVAFCG
ncbi:hypothetical protein V1264_001174 [Littorina saxatilis]|uniref:Uncharacterized protein n=1 Tax=Littorina saxatilis TaxID=31220 RepID=A0AAN9C0U3_9CAEN